MYVMFIIIIIPKLKASFHILLAVQTNLTTIRHLKRLGKKITYIRKTVQKNENSILMLLGMGYYN